MNLKKLKRGIVRFFTGKFTKDRRGNKLSIHRLEENEVDLGKARRVKGRILFTRGNGNTVRIGAGSLFQGKIEVEGSHNVVEIGKNCRIRANLVLVGDHQKITIGDHSTSVWMKVLSSEGCDVSIGRWCMISRQVEIRTTDAHSVVDRTDGRRLNPAEPVSIGNHVWIGMGALIGKGVAVPEDSIVGAMSFVNRSFSESGVVIAGVPAKIVKRGVTWDRKQQESFSPEELAVWKRKQVELKLPLAEKVEECAVMHRSILPLGILFEMLPDVLMQMG